LRCASTATHGHHPSWSCLSWVSQTHASGKPLTLFFLTAHRPADVCLLTAIRNLSHNSLQNLRQATVVLRLSLRKQPHAAKFTAKAINNNTSSMHGNPSFNTLLSLPLFILPCSSIIKRYTLSLFPDSCKDRHTTTLSCCRRPPSTHFKEHLRGDTICWGSFKAPHIESAQSITHVLMTKKCKDKPPTVNFV
jgi:hypothetical protein